MLTNQLTQPLSKKLWISLLIITIGADVILYFSRNSNFMDVMYTNILLFSIFVGVKLAPLLKDQHTVYHPKRKIFSMFVKSFLIIYAFGLLNNFYSDTIFPDFSYSKVDIAEDFNERVESYNEEVALNLRFTLKERIFEWLDTIGYDLYYYSLGGLEEIWRLAYIVILLSLIRKWMPRVWDKVNKDLLLIVGIIITAVLFGVGHSLSEEQEWSVFVGSVVSYTNMGLVLGYLLILTRSLWMLVIVHGLYNVLISMTWGYFDYTIELFVIILLILNGLLWGSERLYSKLVNSSQKV